MKRPLLLFAAAATITAVAAGSLFALTQSASSAANAIAFAAKDNAEGAVTVSVTPQEVSQSAATWRFAVQLNTHVTPLSENMVAVASLVGGKAVDEQPMAWEGDPPGGHHRRGVLVFQPINPAPATLTLHIREVGGIADRAFTWDLGG